MYLYPVAAITTSNFVNAAILYWESRFCAVYPPNPWLCYWMLQFFPLHSLFLHLIRVLLPYASLLLDTCLIARNIYTAFLSPLILVSLMHCISPWYLFHLFTQPQLSILLSTYWTSFELRLLTITVNCLKSNKRANSPGPMLAFYCCVTKLEPQTTNPWPQEPTTPWKAY